MRSLFAVSPPGLEEMVAAELHDIGVPRTRVEEGGVAFRGDDRVLFNANLRLRIASRILVRVARFHASEFHELERNLRKVAWSAHVSRGQQVTLRVTCRKSRLYHSDAVAERVATVLDAKAAAVAQSLRGSETDADAESGDNAPHAAPGQLIVVRLFRDTCSISADSSGLHLHRRGYREATAKAPMRENLAAALITASGWTPELAFMDPMCGSGTIAIEAALIARNIPPGLARADRSPRRYAFQDWEAHDTALWNSVVSEAGDEMLPAVGAPIIAGDRNGGAIQACSGNAERAGVLQELHISQRAVSAIERPADTGALVTNPPYGKRVGNDTALKDLYASLGNTVRNRLTGWTITLLSADPRRERVFGLHWKHIASTSNGGIPVRIITAAV